MGRNALSARTGRGRGGSAHMATVNTNQIIELVLACAAAIFCGLVAWRGRGHLIGYVASAGLMTASVLTALAIAQAWLQTRAAQ